MGIRARSSLFVAASLCPLAAFAQPQDATEYFASPDHAAIQYEERPASDPVARLNIRLDAGEIRLRFEPGTGYLHSTLEALGMPVESQILNFAKNSFQGHFITPRNPRALYFNDTAAVGWVRGGDVVEVAAQDPTLGVIFYVLDQVNVERPRFRRRDACLACHDTETGVPGMLSRSVYPAADGLPLSPFGLTLTDHRTPMEDRWGGWYVTGTDKAAPPMRHRGNSVVVNPNDRGSIEMLGILASLDGRFDRNGYLSPHSDIAALMVFEHQMHMVNLLTRAGWEARSALYEEANRGRDFVERRIRKTAGELVDYMLFVDEAQLSGSVQGESGFAEWFSDQGPKDKRGRSLRSLDLKRRLMRYPCSYMIYTPAFDALPKASKEAVYARMWEILSGRETSGRYSHLSPADRQAIVEILRDTKRDLPAYFSAVAR